MEKDPIYIVEKKDNPLLLSEEQKDAVRAITLGIEEVDPIILDLAVNDVIPTLENGHPLNRVITDEQGKVSGYIACEDFFPEAYIKYLGTTKSTGKNLLSEIPAFLEYAKAKGYTKLSFHGWNARLNRILERYGFERIRTDTKDNFGVDFYEKILTQQKNPEEVAQKRIRVFEDKYITELQKEYQRMLTSFPEQTRQEKERNAEDTFSSLSKRLENGGVEFGERQQLILKIKLARHFQNYDSIDANVLYDAIIESPKFINTDKGSFFRLLEVHQEKTLMKIAEMRKRKAEQTGETFNPYEALFTTKSGNYYVARLLNMPHLEEESEYMSHCVGTSDSYINRMKRGEIEILSFRNIPTIDDENNKLNADDTPLITIEYNVKTKIIEQMKKENDEYLTSSDPFYEDVVDALKQLRITTTDIGEPRDFKKINNSELENIAVEDYHFLTDQGEISFKDFDPKSNLFIFKMGRMEITPDIPKEDAAKMMNIVERIEILPEHIAYTLSEVTEHTKAYVGPLEPGIFQKFPDNLTHIYTSFPDKKITKETLQVGGKTAEEYKNELTLSNIQISGYAGSMLDNPDFETHRLKNPEEVTLVKLTVADLGFTKNPTTEELYTRAEKFGLELCPPDTGPEYLLKYTNQPLGEWVRIGMKQITDPGGSPLIFNLVRRDDGLWLGGAWASPDSEWHPGNEFVFRLRKSES